MSVCASCGFTAETSFRFCPECGAPVVGESREQRKTVTVLFCDLTGSTELGESTDPEALRALLARYFEQMKGIVESHGGTVEKFIGDAVMAVFGVPVAHEDDALRACRAAVEMRDALPGLGIRGRIGVNTGEVVTGTSERLATGDVVNVAARFEQAAEPGSVLIGSATYALVDDAVVAESIEPLILKGKSEPVPAFRLVSVLDAPERSHDSRFVGRELELDQIATAWVRAGAEQRCELVTIVADAGVGKSRLATEALHRLGARVGRGRCLSYGEGITYWPVVEVVKQLGARPSDPVAAAAIGSLLGEGDFNANAEEIAWAFRKLLEEQAPVVCLFEDIHWGEETFLDLVEHVALLSAGFQLLLLCTARPELIERRPSWQATVRLAPLGVGDVEQLVPTSLPSTLREQIARAAGGNPLFVTEMVAMAESAEGEVTVPPNLRALLAARLDQIDEAERRVLERGAVEGEMFHRGAVQALAPEEPQVTARLAGLVRRELVRPEKAQISGEDGFRFRHILVRDAAYDALAKSARAELHERFADWLDEHSSELIEREEILGYHLEQAYRYRVELGRDDEHTSQLGDRASEHLANAGYAAWGRDDAPAAVSLLGRALELATGYERRLQLELDIIHPEGRVIGYGAAAEHGAALAERCHRVGDERGELLARLEQLCWEQHVDPKTTVDRLNDLSQQAIEKLESSNDDAALLRAWYARATAAHSASRPGEQLVCAKHILELADRVGDTRRARVARELVVLTATYGPTPVCEALELVNDYLRSAGPDRVYGSLQAHLLAMLGRFDEARLLDRLVCEMLAEQGMTLGLASIRALGSPLIEALAGNYEEAERICRDGCMVLEAHGEKSWLSTASPLLGQFLLTLGRPDEADEWAEQGRRLGADEDRITQMLWRQVKAKVLSERGEHETAEQLAREALLHADAKDLPDQTAEAHADLAHVLQNAGKPDAAAEALSTALTLYTRKGNIVMTERIRARLHESGSSR